LQYKKRETSGFRQSDFGDEGENLGERGKRNRGAPAETSAGKKKKD